MKKERINIFVRNDAPSPNNRLIEDNIIRIEVEANLFDLSIGTSPSSNVDRTALIDDDVYIESLLIQISLDTATENFLSDVRYNPGLWVGKLIKVSEGYARTGVFRDVLVLRDNAITYDGTPSTILSRLGEDDGLSLISSVSGKINLATGNVFATGIVDASLRCMTSGKILNLSQALFDELKIELIGYSVNAKLHTVDNADGYVEKL